MKKQSNRAKIILASKSPRRKAILKQIGASFASLESAHKEEKQIKNPTPSKVKDLVMRNAKGKAFPSAAWKGKTASVLQGLGILWLFIGFPFPQVVVALVAVFGGFVAVDYLRRL